jgi:hypothetical protein
MILNFSIDVRDEHSNLPVIGRIHVNVCRFHEHNEHNFIDRHRHRQHKRTCSGMVTCGFLHTHGGSCLCHNLREFGSANRDVFEA